MPRSHGKHKSQPCGFFQRLSAAALAISLRRSGESVFDRASPPTAEARCRFVSFAKELVLSPVAMSAISFASWFGSRGRFGVLVMPALCHTRAKPGQERSNFKLTHYPLWRWNKQRTIQALCPETFLAVLPPVFEGAPTCGRKAGASDRRWRDRCLQGSGADAPPAKGGRGRATYSDESRLGLCHTIVPGGACGG